MSQRLIQQGKSRQNRQKLSTKRLTIHEISPQWARLLPLIPKTEEQQFYKDGVVLDISNPKFCIVGEAHKFNGDYMNCMNKESFCRGCHAHSMNFSSILLDEPSNRKALVSSFVRHWNNVHV